MKFGIVLYAMRGYSDRHARIGKTAVENHVLDEGLLASIPNSTTGNTPPLAAGMNALRCHSGQVYRIEFIASFSFDKGTLVLSEVEVQARSEAEEITEIQQFLKSPKGIKFFKNCGRYSFV